MTTLNRRTFIAGSMAGGIWTSSASSEENSSPTTVAAIQMGSHVGDIDANLEEAENWIRYAIRSGAKWVVLPEFFASGMSYQPDKMLDAIQPIDGQATQMLRQLSQQGGAYIGGTFLAKSGDDVFNSFVMASPDGQVFTHDKDFPSGFVEHSFYAGGEDDVFVQQLQEFGIKPAAEKIHSRPENIKTGVFPLADSTAVGVAICWEQIRYRTARRLRGKVDLVLASSAWGILDPDVGVAEVKRDDLVRWAEETSVMLRKTPGRLARLVGSPVIHANTVGSGWSRDGRKGKPPMLGRGMGDSQIVDARGTVLARRPHSDGEGVVFADVPIGRTMPADEVSDGEFWTPDFSDGLKQSWYNGGSYGREYYLNRARHHRNRQGGSRGSDK
ncbi:MAG: carbon-nitrogen hydrolase family protein [Planctomycetales bacterium]|nr:carbon-nitrogen hydrolase family protein [Planctomycetales bacterium]